MKLLYITNGYPYPLTSGYLRHYHFLSQLAEHHEIRLFSMAGADHRPEDVAAIDSLGVESQVYLRETHGAKGWEQRLAKLVPPVATGPLRELAADVASLVASGWPDAALFSGKDTYPALAALGDTPVLIDVCDATSVRLRGQIRQAGPRKFVTTGLQLLSTTWIERRLTRAGRHAIVASERDRDALASSGDITVVPNGVDAGFWKRTSARLGEDTIVFCGKLDYPPNEDAALRLVDEVLPLVREVRPAAELLLIGRAPTARLLAAAQARPGAACTGEVADVRPHLELGSVFAAPLRFGAGIQNKLLEALAMELPIVASGQAAAGLVVDGDPPPVTTADSASDLAAAIVRALEVVDASPVPNRSGRSWVTERFDWKRSAQRVEGLLDRLVGTEPVRSH